MNTVTIRRSMLAGLFAAVCGALLSHPVQAAMIPLKGPSPDDPNGPVLDLGWTADVPDGVELTNITISGTTIVLTKKATFHDFNPISIMFTQDPTVAAGKEETFFNVREDITNMTGTAWNDFHMTIADDNDNTSDSGITHPIRAHFHPREDFGGWKSSDPMTDYLVSNLPEDNKGKYVMDLELKADHAPTAGDGGKLMGEFVRLHDKREANANRMKFTLTEQPSAVPEPATLVLLGVGVLGLVAASRLRRHRS